MAENRSNLDVTKTDYHIDSRYKRYEAAIDKNLSTFETISEWADIIAFLSRLNKVSLAAVTEHYSTACCAQIQSFIKRN